MSPAPTSTEAQIVAPIEDHSRKRENGILAMPAGRQITPRTPGRARPAQTAKAQYLRNQAFARSTSRGVIATHRPPRARLRLNRSSPRRRPTAYQAAPPRIEPADPARTAASGFTAPFDASNPARGRISSEGMTGMRFSTSMSRKTPARPVRPMIPAMRENKGTSFQP
jgi:hypothetical protein